MEDVTRKRIHRLLEELPEERLYQVLDYIEFLAAKAEREAGRKPDAFQRFAERVEDQMRVRSVAPKAMRGTMRLMSTAGKVLDGVRGLGEDVVAGLDVEGSGRRRARSKERDGAAPSTPDREDSDAS